MSGDVSQTFLLLATFDIALIAVAIATYAVSVSYLGRETRLSRWRTNKRKDKLNKRLKQLQSEKVELSVDNIRKTISDYNKEIKSYEKEIARLSNRLVLLSAWGAVFIPSIFFIISFILAVVGMNLNNSGSTIWVSSIFVAAGLTWLFIVVNCVDSVAKEFPLPKFEVYFSDMVKTINVKRKLQQTITICVNNIGEDIAENLQIFVNFPKDFTVGEAYGAVVQEQGADTEHSDCIAAIFNLKLIHIDTIVRLPVILTPPDATQTYEIPIDIYETKTGKTKYNLTIAVVD